MTRSEGLPVSVVDGLSAWRRQRALEHAVRRRLARRWLVRLGRVGAWYVAFVHGALAVWLLEEPGGGSVLFSRALGYVTILAAVVAAGAAIDLRDVERADGLDALCRLRGFSEAERSAARLAATTRLVTSTLLGPALALGVLLVGLSQTFADVVARSLRLLAALAYAPLAGLVLAALCRWSVALAPRRPRTLFVALLVVPHLVFMATGDGPSVIRLLSDLLDRIESLVGGIG